MFELFCMIFGYAALILLGALVMTVMLFEVLGWLFAILAFIFSGVPLGIALLILWIIILGAS